MFENKPPQRIEAETPVRTLKIEADGVSYKRLAKPKIRLIGRWLERAGFSPGGHVQVKCVAPGVIELRCIQDWTMNDANLPSTKQPGIQY